MADPGETRDLAADFPEVVRRLRAELAAWHAEVGAVRVAENPEY